MTFGITAIRRVIASFKKSDEGSVAIIFALVLIPILGITATAIDYGRASRVKSALTRAADAAVLEVSTMMHRPDDVIEDEIRRQLDANLPADLKGIEFQMHIPSNRSSVEIKMETSVKTTIAGVMGIMALDLAVTAKADRVTHPTNGKITPEMARQMEKQLRRLIQQAGGLGSGGFGGGGGGGFSGGFGDGGGFPVRTPGH